MRILIFLCLVWLTGVLSAQKPDSLARRLDTTAVAAASDTQAVVRKPGFIGRFFSKDYPNPRKAAFLSLALPGAGQAYNRHWWKMPIVYAVFGGPMYLELDNLGEYHRLRDNYKLLVDGDDKTNPTEAPYIYLDATSMKQYRDQWRKYVEQSSLALGLAYVLTATEAFVDAHLSRFDVSDDLTLRISPKAQALPGSGVAFGMGVALQFGSVRNKTLPALP